MPAGMFYRATSKKLTVAPKKKRKTFSSKVKKVLTRNKEWKYHDQAYSATTISTSGQTAGIIAGAGGSGDGIAQGDDDDQREGDVIEVYGVHFEGEVLLPMISNSANNQASGDTLRMMIVYDRRPSGAFAGVTDIVQLTDINSQLNHDNNRNGGRFRILMDRRIDLKADVSSSFDTVASALRYDRHVSTKSIRFHKRYKQPLVVKYKDAADGEIDDIDKGNIMCLLFSSLGSAQWLGEFRVEYKDR